MRHPVEEGTASVQATGSPFNKPARLADGLGLESAPVLAEPTPQKDVTISQWFPRSRIERRTIRLR
jgi:hypothetical protein